ncbi:restriction endonuclease [Methylobacterium sp. A49B]|uniref:Restriction endonuclease n=1 Tax=Methylobacterium mesophilicum SR1.6/6 TaxID=908290 RepID=A0A6B9FM44_9HYPH|nr:restriction endonuclease [Methylobacterium mesophilicum]QGY02195.1 restriction endonuclease [Methylobacterium mesophilicum SR1.6/6]
MPGKPNLVARLFWTAVIGCPFALWYGRPALAATGFALVLVVLRHLGRPRRFRARVRRIARAHRETLALRRRQESFSDAYGNWIEDGWLRERDYFIDRTVLPQIGSRYADLADAERARMLAIVEAEAAAVALPEEEDAPEDGLDYERFCAARLVQAGWRAHRTPASGDQGADIVAVRDGLRLVVQCKRLSKPVGNAAVQEAAAAQRYWSGDRAAVVSNAGFTPAARRLAAATGVLLIHHDALDAIDLAAA